MNKIKIKHCISLGFTCHTAFFLKTNNLKFCSYPYDWIFTNYNTILDTLNDNFNKFLDKIYYIKIENERRCGHKIYGKSFFNHKNPLNDEDYDYYKRCIERFKNILNNPESKLFIITNINQTKEISNENINKLNMIYNKLNSITTNFNLLCINSILNEKLDLKNPIIESTKISKIQDNFYLVNFYTKTKSSGIRYSNKEDDDNYKNIIFNMFDFS